MDASTADLTDPDLFRQGGHHGVFAHLRTDDPVHWQSTDEGGFWNLTRHADVVEVNRDQARFSSMADGVNIRGLDEWLGPDAATQTRQMMIMMDPPRHTRFRLLVNKGFTPRMINLLEHHLAYKARTIVSQARTNGTGDFVTDVAAHLPLDAIAELMGIPAEDRQRIFAWSNAMVGSDDPDFEGDHDSAIGASAEMYVYSLALREMRRTAPADDIVSTLLGAEVEGEGLTDDEFAMFFLLLAVAGNETTRNATSHGMLALMERPEQLARLMSGPDDLLATAVEEIIRWACPIHHFRRTATVDTAVGGTEISAGDAVVMWYVSANRDESVFTDPMTFDIARSPNDHVSFGAGGPHFCLGANLARMELRLIFRELLTNPPTLTGAPELLRSNFVHGVKHLPVDY